MLKKRYYLVSILFLMIMQLLCTYVYQNNPANLLSQPLKELSFILTLFVVSLICQFYVSHFLLMMSAFIKKRIICILLDIGAIVSNLLVSPIVYFILQFISAEGCHQYKLLYVVLTLYHLIIVIAIVKLIDDITHKSKHCCVQENC